MTIHILRMKKGKQNAKPFDTRKLTKLQREFLERKVCANCEIRLTNTEFCGTFFDDPCDQKTRNKRIIECLKEYKPREKGAK